MVKNR